MTLRPSKETLRREVVNLLFITLGILIYSVGFTLFLLPHHIVIGGMAGFSTLVYYATAGAIPVAVTMYAANSLLLLIGLRSLGRGFLLRTLFGMTAISVMIGVFEGWATSHPPLISGSSTSMVIGAVLCGLGIGIYYSHHGTCGGTDIVAALVTRRSQMSVGRIMMIVDLSIVALSFFLPFDGTLEQRVQDRTQTIILGWIAIAIYSFIADKYIYIGNQTMQFIIISDSWHLIAERVTHETGRGVTIWDAEGFWSGEHRKKMMIWCRQHDAYAIYNIVRQVDSGAYITGCNVKSIYGNGFDFLPAPKPNKHNKS